MQGGRMKTNEFILCTEPELLRHIWNLRSVFPAITSPQWVDTEIAKIAAELKRRDAKQSEII